VAGLEFQHPVAPGGVPARVAKKLTVDQTRSLFDRYQIVSQGYLEDVARLLVGTFSGTPAVRRLLGAP